MRRLLAIGWIAGWALVACESEKKPGPPAVVPDAGEAPAKSAPKNPWASLVPATLGKHEGTAFYVGFSGDGKWLVSTGKDKLIKLWETTGWQPVKTLSGHTGDVMMADFSPDGKLLVSASADQTARIWDVDSGKALKVLKDAPPKKMTPEEELAFAQLPPPLMNWAAFSPDGKQVITASDDFALKLWDVASGKKIGTFRDDGCRQRRVVRRKDAAGWLSAAGCVDDGVTYLKFWDLGGNLISVQGDENHDAHYLALDRAGKFIVAADGSVSFTLFSAQGSLLRRIMVGTYHFCLAFGPEDKTLLVGTDGGEIFVYRPGPWTREGKIDIGDKAAVEAMAISPADGSLVAALRSGAIVRFSTPIR